MTDTQVNLLNAILLENEGFISTRLESNIKRLLKSFNDNEHTLIYYDKLNAYRIVKKNELSTIRNFIEAKQGESFLCEFNFKIDNVKIKVESIDDFLTYYNEKILDNYLVIGSVCTDDDFLNAKSYLLEVEEK